MENSFTLGRKLIETELDAGVLNFIIKPIIKTFYDLWAKQDARNNTLKQIKITLDAGLELLKNGASDENFSRIAEENFPKYLEADQTSLMANHEHKNYSRLKNVTKETFINYLKEIIKLLNVENDVKNYGDLCRVAFKLKELAEENLMRQLSFTEEAIKIIEEDPSILKVVVGKKTLVKVLRRGFEITKAEFINGLNDTYD
ncbi:hypothetical protein LCGC14_1298050 [marine sediment metagenome]|uniref:Uncharacterized protein n=1 Tax=marine sediment metagenome TaxID=412755 RepID=A0A0F9N720_9ZZZZ